VIEALFDAFDSGKNLGNGGIIRVIQGTVPLSVTMAEQIKSLRKWSDHRARSANRSKSTKTNQTRRIAA
jgi:hypothetical protein